MTEERHYLKTAQINFLNWITKNKLKELNDGQRNIMNTFKAETSKTVKQGYLVGSLYEVRLNQIRNKYLNEYTQYR